MKKFVSIFFGLLLAAQVSSSANAQILYENNFNEGNLDDWTELYDYDAWTIQDGTLQLDTLGIADRQIMLGSVILPRSFTFEFDARAVEPGGGSLGAAYMHQLLDVESGAYPFAYGDCLMYSYEKGTFYTTETGGGVEPPFYYVVQHNFVDYTQWHHMKFIKNDLVNTLYFDDQLIFEVTSPVGLTGGYFALGGGTNGVYQFDNLRITVGELISIDIKPGFDPNTIILTSKGSVPVAILTTADFDASTVDPTTAKFADASPIKRRMVDVDRDGDVDMLLYFNIEELNLDTTSTQAILTGTADDGTDDGKSITGIDSVNIVTKGKK